MGGNLHSCCHQSHLPQDPGVLVHLPAVNLKTETGSGQQSKRMDALSIILRLQGKAVTHPENLSLCSLAPFSPTTMQIIQIQHFNELPKLCKTFQILGQFGFPSVQSFTRIWWCGVACGKVSAATCNSITASQCTGAYWPIDSPSLSYLSSRGSLDSDPEKLKDS